MTQLVTGRLMGIQQFKLSVETLPGEVKVLARRELDVSVNWALNHIGHTVTCLLRDGVVTRIEAA